MRINMRIVSKAVTLGVVICLSGSSPAQEEIFSLGMQLGTGARAIAMGGAYTSVGGDFSASFWNPAALANIRRVEFSGSLSHLMRQSTAEFSDIPFNATINQNEENFTRFNDLGLAYPVPTQQGSLVFSFGYNRVKSYDSNFDFRGFNPDDSVSVNQAWKELETGSLNTWTASGAMAVSPNMSVGIGLNFWTGGSDFQTTFREVDIDDIYTFENFTRDDGLNTNISGFNVKLGGLIDLPLLRLGATISTPITFKVKEDFFTSEKLLDDNLDLAEEFFDEGFFEYRIKSPWTFTGGASLNLLNFVFSGDLEYNDWKQIAYKTDPPFTDENGDELTQGQANLFIRNNYRATTRIRLGGEFTLPLTGLSFRAGYFRDPSMFQGASSEEDKQFYSAGIGFLVDKQVRLDVALVHGFWKNFNQGLPGTDDIIDEEVKVNKAFVSLAFRL